MNAFENETFEGIEDVSADSESSGGFETVATVLFNKETGEVTEEPDRTGRANPSEDSRRPIPKRAKRTEYQMIASFNGNAMRESVYVLERLSKLEGKMSELLNSVGIKAQAMIVSERPELSRFVK